ATMTQEFKQPAQLLAAPLTLPLSPMTPIESNNDRPCKLASLSSEHKPLFHHGYPHPSFSSSLCQKQVISDLSSTSFVPSLPSNIPSPSVAGPQSELITKGPYKVRFLPNVEYRPEDKDGHLPRTPYPLTKEEEEQIFQSFLSAVNEEE
ncbi:hypothetical protein FBU30_010539, partial [Linnemannia zychae]